MDSYGGAARHGGGAFSGKAARRGARWAARHIVQAGLARRVEIEVAYAIGEWDPVALNVDTFGIGDQHAAEEFVRSLDFHPAAIIERLDLRRPLFAATTNYGHFGKVGLPWEA